MADEDKKKKRWSPKASTEQDRLSPKESDWNLAGIRGEVVARTRGKRGSLTWPPTPPSPVVTDHGVDEPPKSTEQNVCQPCKSESTRVIIEADPFVGILEAHLMNCPACIALPEPEQNALSISLSSVSIATTITIRCNKCGYERQQKSQYNDIPLPPDSGSALIERTADYSTNVLSFLAFLTKGNGGAEASHYAGLMGLPHATTMETGGFKAVEAIVGPHLQALAEEVIVENLRREVNHYYGGRKDENGIKLYDRWLAKDPTLPKEQWPRLNVSTDMGWQKRSSGKRYDSQSGHAFLVAVTFRLPIAWHVSCKGCRMCKSWYTHHGIDEDAPEHDCVKNHEGSSGSMEPLAVLEMVKYLYQKHLIVIEVIITDDDSSIKAKLKWSNEDHMLNTNTTKAPTIINSKGNVVERPNHGRLPRDMEQPRFLADPNHRKKTLKGALYRLAGSRKADRVTMTKIDCIRISTNFAYFIRTLPNKERTQWKSDSRAVLDHHFDMHDNCGEWCYRKKEKEPSNKFYRCPVKDKKLYDVLQYRIARFITTEGLDEVGHGWDTQVNESLNQSIAWVAPKNKHYSGTQSLKNRISVVVCNNGLGILEFYERLFGRLNVQMPADTRNYLQWRDRQKKKRLLDSKMPKNKKAQQKNFHIKMKEHAEDAKKERAKRDGGLYMPGVGLDGGYIIAKEDLPEPEKKKRKSKQSTYVCPLPLCGLKGHKTKRSKYCKYNPANPNYVGDDRASANLKDDNTTQPSNPTAGKDEEQQTRDAEEQDIMDSLPIDDDFYSAEEFSSGRSSSENEDFDSTSDVDSMGGMVASNDYK